MQFHNLCDTFAICVVISLCEGDKVGLNSLVKESIKTHRFPLKGKWDHSLLNKYAHHDQVRKCEPKSRVWNELLATTSRKSIDKHTNDKVKCYTRKESLKQKYANQTIFVEEKVTALPLWHLEC